MYPIKQSTTITVPFFVHDASGDAVTGLTDGSFTKRISKNGAAFGAMTVTITEMENGWYSIPLSTSHTDTLGLLTIVFTNAGSKQVNLQFRIHARIPDDLAYPTVSGRSIDVETTGEVGINLDNTTGTLTSTEITSVAGAVLADSSSDAIIADAVWNAATATYGSVGSYGEALEAVDTSSVTVTTNNDKTGYTLSASGVDAIWDEATTGHVTAGTFAVAVTDVLTDTNSLNDTKIPQTLNLTASGNIGIDWANVENPTTIVNLSATNIDVDQVVASVSGSVNSVTSDVGVNEWNGVALSTTNPLPNAAAGAAGGLPTDSTGKTSFNDISTAQVNAEVVDALNTDTYAEPGQGAPASTTTLAAKINYLYKAWRNRSTQTATTYSLYNDDAITVDQKATVSDDGTTADKGEVGTGP